LRTGHCRDGTAGCVGQCHAHDIGERQREAAHRRRILTRAGDHARQDRHHRQHARRKREQQTKAVERAENEPPGAVDNQTRKAVLFRDHRFECDRRVEFARRRDRQRHGALHRRIADAVELAALSERGQLELDGVRCGSRERDSRLDVAEVNENVTELEVIVWYAFRQFCGAEPDRPVRLELEFVGIQVVAGLDRPADDELVGPLDARVHDEGLLGR